MSEVWGWLRHVAFVFVVKMTMYICLHSPWCVTECKLKMCSQLVRALAKRYFFYDFLLTRILGLH